MDESEFVLKTTPGKLSRRDLIRTGTVSGDLDMVEYLNATWSARKHPYQERQHTDVRA